MTTQLYTLSDAEFNQLVGVPWQLGQSLRTRINAAFALGIERARLAQSDWVRVEDALPVAPEGEIIGVWVFSDYVYDVTWFEDSTGFTPHVTHWRYMEPTPQPPSEQAT